MKINITNSLQNSILGIAIVLLGLFIMLTSSSDISKVPAEITAKEYTVLSNQTANVEEAVSRFFRSQENSASQIFYDKRIEKAISVRNTRLYPLYRQKAQDALVEFAMFKNYQDIALFTPEFNVLAAVNRSLSFSDSLLVLLKNRLENFKNNQVILDNIHGKSVVFTIMKLKYDEDSYVYLVLAQDLIPVIADLPKFDTKEKSFYLVTKTLSYKDSLLTLDGTNNIASLFLKEDTLIKYSKYFSRSFDDKGNETVSNIKDLQDSQYSYILGMIDFDYLNSQIKLKQKKLQDYYIVYYVLLAVLVLLYSILLYTQVNLQQKAIVFISKVRNHFDPNHNVVTALDLSKQVQKQAYSYAEKEDNIKNTMFKAYSILKKMSPEDVRSLSIKNSLSKENIRLVYQPVVNSKTMKVEFCEVYLRLLNYYGDELMPSEFIPVLKHFNMLENLDEMMLEKVIKKIQTLQSTDSQAKISLNISSGAFNSDKFLRKLKTSFITGEINTNNVMLELPALDMINDNRSIDFISELTNYGVIFAVSVNTLDSSTTKKILDHKIKYVKIDMSAFSNVLENEDQQANLKQILANSNKHNINLIAERIETELMFKLAKSLEIELLQGYYIGKPKKYYKHNK